MIDGSHRFRTAHDHPYAALVAEVGNAGPRTVGLPGTREVWAALQSATRCVMVELDTGGHYTVRVLTGRRGGTWDESLTVLEGNVNDVVLQGNASVLTTF
jgi:hypothetical protein